MYYYYQNLKKRVSQMFDKAPPELQAMLLSMALAVLRVVYDKEETRALRILIESLICGCLTLTAFHAVAAFGLDLNWAVVAGGVIGFVGANTVRGIAVRFLNKRV